MLTVDIDTGGTMTDALVSDGETRHAFKVDTTPHDYTVSFLACLREAAGHFGDDSIAAFLSRVGLIRWSSTITTNVLGERRGSKVGLFVSRGNERTLYGAARSPVLGELVDEANVIGLSENPSDVEVLAGVKRLLEGGVRRICVCLADSFPDSRFERAIKETIEDQYPDHIIGAVPVLLGSEMAPLRHDQTRVHYSVMNAYTHMKLATSLFKAEDLLRDEHSWRGPLLIGHTSGGVARIGKTKAVDTMESGPVFGTYGGAWMARLYGLDNAVCFDVGGTTTKASVVRDGAPVLQRGGELLDVPVQAPLVLLRSAVVGGGSIARIRNGAITLGPESMGAAPGPACYGLGGDKATLTDALLVLGYLDPANFLGGRRSLKADAARGTIEKHVAAPLGISVEAAALSIRDEAVAMMSDLLAGALAEARVKNRDTPLFAFGGNGPMFACFVADRLELPAAYAFHLGPVFGAFGSAVSDVVHRYEYGLALHWDAGARAALAPHLEEMMEQAVRDLRGEGFDPEHATYQWELDFPADVGGETTVQAAGTAGSSRNVFDAIELAVTAADCANRPVLALRLLTRYAVGSHGVSRRTNRGEARSATKRPLRFNGAPAIDAPVYQWEELKTGQVIEGPGAINGNTLTCPVPPGWKAKVDDFGNLALNRAD